MSELTDLRDHARSRALWPDGRTAVRVACKTVTTFGREKPADHANCGGDCACRCHRPTEHERRMWQQIADEIDAYLGRVDEGEALW